MSRPLGTPDELERRRRLAVERVRQGEKPTVVARVLGVNRTSLYRWRKAADQGPKALAAVPQRGPTPRLSDDQLHELDRLLRQGAAYNLGQIGRARAPGLGTGWSATTGPDGAGGIPSVVSWAEGSSW